MPALIIVPSEASVEPGGVAHFRVAEPANVTDPVQWSVATAGGGDAGTIDDQGKYTAPAATQATMQVTVTAHAGALEGNASVVVKPADAAPPPDGRGAAAGGSGPQTISIAPATVVLSAKATQHFQARTADGQPAEVTWSLFGTGGLAADLVGSIDALTGIYTAPAEISGERNVIVLAAAPTGAVDKAFVVLTPGGVLIVPADVSLRANEPQQFSAVVRGDTDNDVEWLTSPKIGSFAVNPSRPGSIVFTAPIEQKEDAKVVVTALSKATGMTGHANVTLLADEWKGWAPRRIGIWLMFLAIIVPALYIVWPPPGDRLKMAAAVAARNDAARLVEQRADAVNRLTATLKDATEKFAANEQKTAADQALAQELKTQIDTTRASLSASQDALADAKRDDKTKTSALEAEQKAQQDNANDERVLFVLVLLAGALGSFVHTTRSFVDFVGNRRLRPSWSWWYVLQPFTGAALAMVMYLVIRGGFFATATGATGVNPWGLVAVAALVGLFSKQATNKLDELFSTMFRTEKDRELRDKLAPGASQATGKSSSSSTP